MKSFRVIEVTQIFASTGPTQRRLSYTYPDDSREAVSGNWKQFICLKHTSSLIATVTLTRTLKMFTESEIT